MPRSVLVPVDGSNFAEHALPYAIGIARRTGATLHIALVHVPAEEMGPAYPLAEAIRAHHQEQSDYEAEYVAELARRLEPSGVCVRPALLRGRVSTKLVEYVEAEKIALIVMTTHGRGGLQRTWLGSTADSLIRHCMIPILTVRPSRATRELLPERDCEIQRVVAAIDGSGTAETALRDVLELGITRNASLTLVHVLQPTTGSVSPYLPHTSTGAEVRAREAHMRSYLHHLAGSSTLEGWTCECRVLVDPHPAPAVLQVAEEMDADLMALGTHGRGGLRRLILGSVADTVIRGTDRPVLVHRGVGRIARLKHPAHRHQPSERANAHAHP